MDTDRSYNAAKWNGMRVTDKYLAAKKLMVQKIGRRAEKVREPP
jgi:hypothetical protein